MNFTFTSTYFSFSFSLLVASLQLILLFNLIYLLPLITLRVLFFSDFFMFLLGFQRLLSLIAGEID